MSRAETNKKMVHTALLSLTKGRNERPSDYKEWIKTREISDLCNVSIYTARLYLLELEKEGHVLCSHQLVSNSLRWFPA
ncbi:TPA: hypothetical protein SIA35_004285 [Aeromonas sobria]|nr:hypothetical protein [Aeromonas sobria]